MKKNLNVREQWARLGAMARLQELEQERALILATYPDLRSRASAKGLTVVAATAGPRRTMSPAAKKAMSAGMRRYWARRKAAEAKGKG